VTTSWPAAAIKTTVGVSNSIFFTPDATTCHYFWARPVEHTGLHVLRLGYMYVEITKHISAFN